MDKFSYSIGLGIGQNLRGMGTNDLNVEDFAQAVKDVLTGATPAISHTEARQIVNEYFEKLEARINAENIEKGKTFLEENKKNPNVKVLPSGLQYRIIKNGTGKRPDDGSQVTVTYEGRFIDGKVFDSTDKGNGGKPVTLGMGSVVRGWNEALKLMAEGSEWEIYLPYELGYGEEGSDGVPPCSALIFRLKLIDVK